MDANHVTRVNPFVVSDHQVDLHINLKGSHWYWAFTSTTGFTLLAILTLGLRKPANSRIFFYILSAMTFVAMVEYYSMASNLRWIPIDVQWQRSSLVLWHPRSSLVGPVWWLVRTLLFTFHFIFPSFSFIYIFLDPLLR